MGGAPCRPQASRCCNGCQYYYRASERRRIAGRYLNQNARNQSRERCRSRESDRESHRYRPQPVGENGRDNARRVGAERHPDADFFGALNGGVRHHSVDSHRREEKRRRREESQEHGLETRLADTLFDMLLHSADAIHRLIGIEPADHG